MKPVRITQITDTHLGQQVGERLLGVDTDFSLEQVLELLAADGRQSDLLILTGDISSDGYAEAYRRLYKRLSPLGNVIWLPGNHDEPARMVEACGRAWLRRRVELGRWQVLALDSSVPGQPGGTLRPDELALLREQLERYPDHYTLVALHHHVLPVGCAWLDEQLLSNQGELFNLLGTHDKVQALVSGHVHQASDREYRGIRVLTSPSTCVQFAPNSAEFLVGSEYPGYRWLDLYPDGRVETGVSRLSNVELQVDYGAKGY